MTLVPASTPSPSIQPSPDDAHLLFEGLKKWCKSAFANEARPGFWGTWTAEENRGDADIRYLVTDGGYCEDLVSITYGFHLHCHHAPSTNADGMTMLKGTWDDVRQAFHALIELDLPVVKPLAALSLPPVLPSDPTVAPTVSRRPTVG